MEIPPHYLVSDINDGVWQMIFPLAGLLPPDVAPPSLLPLLVIVMLR